MPNTRLWIKYGWSVLSNDVPSQLMAYDGLKKLQSSVQIPKIYYTCCYGHARYIVMDYIPGKTVSELLDELPTRKQDIFNLVAFGLQELLHIPVPTEALRRPAAVNGGRIRHILFDDTESHVDYQNVKELEAHLNEVSSYQFAYHLVYD